MITAPEIANFRIGDIQVTRVTEQVGPGFAPDFLYPDWNPSVIDEHRAWMVPDCFDEVEQKFIASIHTWVVRTSRRTILIDTCAGNDKHRPSLPRFHMLRVPFLERLAAAGVHPHEVDYVLCTHLHADHVGWNTRLIDGRWVPTFPNARYVFSRAEHDHWSGPAGTTGFMAGVYQDSVLPVVEAGLADVVEGDGEILDGLTAHPTPGHSAGHIAFSLGRAGQQGLFTGDVMHQPIQVYNPHWNSLFCEDPVAARASRNWALEHAAETRATVFTAHFARCSAGHVHRHGDGFAWEFAR